MCAVTLSWARNATACPSRQLEPSVVTALMSVQIEARGTVKTFWNAVGAGSGGHDAGA
tara:strand:+ start:558 stop:731 length:174 start_codon:yes stop_codon:yes gene_type:complete